MLYAGIDLHKHSIRVCVRDQHLRIAAEKTLACADPESIRAFFAGLGDFAAVVEATASYEWLWQLLEPRARRLVLAHPGKLRVIAESTKKSDRLDARVLAEFLARGMVPEAYRPTPRQREHRTLVRYRCYLRRRSASARVKVRRMVADHNADRPGLFTRAGLAALRELPLPPAERFVVDRLLRQWRGYEAERREADRRLRDFAAGAPAHEAEARAALASIPGVGPLTVDVVLSEVGDVGRFRSAKEVVAYAGLCPARRESAGKARDLGLTKRGSPWLRWILVQAAWRLVRLTRRWRAVYEAIRARRGPKKAIVAVARRLLTVMVALWRQGAAYRLAA